ncbi:MAG TPA: DUF3300 domain-containing protein [Chitinolyticbacter sp.]|nr:DUF3300 domain-containing protein [Chitinolyticbacter sp.]
MSRAVRIVLLLFAFCLGMPWAQAEDTKPFKPEQLEQLAAPIALYPDALVAQIMMGATYPLEVVEAARWSKANPNVKDKALEDAMAKQSWDASVKSLTAFPQVLQMMNDKLDWTQQLGDAVLAQQQDVMDAVQRLRARAQAEGNLKSGKEQTVTTEATTSGTTVIKIEPTQPEVVYVPTYNPTVVYGTWPYPAYTPYYWYPPGYAAASFFSFSVGVAVGAALWGNCNWGGGDIDIDVNRYNNFNRTNVSNREWNHDSTHRKGVQYRDNATQQRYNREGKAGAQNREQFRGRADAERKNLNQVDRAAVDRATAQNRERDRAQGGDRTQSGDRAAQRPQNRDTQTRDVQSRDTQSRDRASTGTSGNRTSQQRDQAFQGTDRGANATRAASNRGQTSRATSRASRPTRPSGGGSRGGGRR